MTSDRASTLGYFVAGVSLGAAIGVLIAPSSGSEMRQKLSQQAGDGASFFSGSGREYFERGRELYEKGRLLADEAAKMFDEGRKLVAG